MIFVCGAECARSASNKSQHSFVSSAKHPLTQHANAYKICSLIAKAKVSYEYPGVGRSILDLISPTSSAPEFDDSWGILLTVGRQLNGDSFWKQDIEHVLKTVKGYEARIAQGDHVAELELTKFRDERLEHVKQIHHVSLQTGPPPYPANASFNYMVDTA